AAVETGLVSHTPPLTTIRIDSPAGLITARVDSQGVSFDNVASFVDTMNAKVYVPTLGEVRYDLAFGGAYYAIVDAASVALECSPGQVTHLIEAGMRIKNAVAQSRPIRHPFEEDLGFL